MTDDTLKAGDVVQISPHLPDCFFNGCFMLVTEVKSWGAQGFISMPGQRGESPGRAFFRAHHEHMERIGTAAWIAEDLEPAPAPPMVHILDHGSALCGFYNGQVPGDWPSGHKWIRLSELNPYEGDENSQPCPTCFMEAGKRAGLAKAREHMS